MAASAEPGEDLDLIWFDLNDDETSSEFLVIAKK